MMVDDSEFFSPEDKYILTCIRAAPLGDQSTQVSKFAHIATIPTVAIVYASHVIIFFCCTRLRLAGMYHPIEEELVGLGNKLNRRVCGA
ncbi:hypothetical protein AB0H12_30930 [Actinosynnema sp. NPDC023794]